MTYNKYKSKDEMKSYKSFLKKAPDNEDTVEIDENVDSSDDYSADLSNSSKTNHANIFQKLRYLSHNQFVIGIITALIATIIISLLSYPFIRIKQLTEEDYLLRDKIINVKEDLVDFKDLINQRFNSIEKN